MLKISKNFRIVKDWVVVPNKKTELLEKIFELEEMLFKNEINFFDHSLGLLFEMILHQISETNSMNNIIKMIDDEYSPPLRVINSLYALKKIRNSADHYPTREDIKYRTKIDIVSSIQNLKELFLVLKWFAEFNNDDIDDEILLGYQFDSSIYIKNLTTTMKKNDSLSPDSNNIDLKLQGIIELINGEYKFLIPSYQRSYTWDISNIEILFKDIKNRTIDKDKHYMGSLAIAVDQNKKIYRLIDGQQRITTSMLIAKAIFDHANGKSFPIPKEIENLNKKLKDKYMNASHSSMKSVSLILKGFILENDISFKNSNAFSNYKYMMNEFDNMDEMQFKEFYITFIYNFVISVIKFPSNPAKETLIFENLNSKGTGLSEWDIIKNIMFRKVDTELLVTSEDDINAEIMKRFVYKVNIKLSSKNKNNKVTKILSKFFEFYNRVIISQKKLNINKKSHKIHEIFSIVWNRMDGSIKSVADFVNSIDDISKYLDIYLEIIFKEFIKPSSPLFEFRLHLENMSMKDVHIPSLMHFIFYYSTFSDDTFKIQEKNKIIILKLIRIFDLYLTRLISVKNQTQSLGKIFDLSIAESIEAGIYKFKEKIMEIGTVYSAPSLSDFYNVLKTKKDWQTEYAMAILRTIEYDISSFENKEYSIILKPSLEHIISQRPKKGSQLDKKMNSTEFRLKFIDHLNMLGNFLILSMSLNLKAKNNDFIIKKIEYNKLSSKILYKGFEREGKIILSDLSKKEDFTFTDVKKRSLEMANYVINKYKFDWEDTIE